MMGDQFGDAVRTRQDDEFEAVMGAIARMSRKTWTDEDRRQIEAANHRNDPLHKKALARRRKRKRGGHK